VLANHSGSDHVGCRNLSEVNNVKAKISGKEVVQSGLLIGHSDDEITLFPFDDDLEFKVLFKFEFAEGAKPEATVLEPDPPVNKFCIVRFRRPFKRGETFSNRRPLVIAMTDDEQSDYLANIVVSVIGVEGAYTLMVAYTIFLSGRE
jgi:hypothetical protein